MPAHTPQNAEQLLHAMTEIKERHHNAHERVGVLGVTTEK
jgi:hypothetical protein